MSIVSPKIKRMREKRISEIKKQKSFLPALVITIFLWFALISIVLFTNPSQKGLLELFFAVLFTSFLFTFSLILGHTRRGLIAALTVSIFAVLRYFGIGNALNLLLIIGAATAFEFYFTKSK